jgi:hypothetical protein
MIASTYDQLFDQVRKLSYYDQLRLLADVATLLRFQETAPYHKHSLLELEGLGKEVWEGINVKEYLNQERNSWDG